MRCYRHTHAASLVAVFMLTSAPLVAQQPRDHAEERAEIAEFFQQYQQATRQETPDDLVALYDFKTMTDEIVAQAAADLPGGLQQMMVRSLQQQVGQQLMLFGGQWYRHKVVSIKFFGSDDHAEVFVRGWNDNQETMRELFWLHRTGGQWRIYDFMDMSMGLACTKLGALGLKQGLSGDFSAASMKALRSLLTAVQHVGQDEIDEALAEMRKLMGKPIPSFIDSARWFFDAAIALADDPARSLEFLDKATSFQPDLPMADFMRAAAYNLIDRHHLAAEAAERFINRYGDDADAYHEWALALEALDKKDQAIEQLRKALADTPNSLINVEHIGLLLPKDNKAEFATYFQALRDEDKSDSFQYLADSFELEEDGEVLDALVKSMAKINPDERLLDYYRAVVMSSRGQHQQAVKHLKAVLQKISDDDEDRYLYEAKYLSEAINADMLLQAYQQAENPQEFAAEAFESIIDRGQYDRGLEMVNAYLQDHPNDPTAHLWAGDLEYYRDRFQQADEHYARGLARQSNDGDVKDELAYSRALSWYRMGKALEAYKQLSPKGEFFRNLAQVLDVHDEEETLDKLLELRKADAPDSMAVAQFSAALMFDRQQYDQVIALLQRSVQHHERWGNEDELGLYPSFRLSTDEILIRSLIRTKQLKRAREAASNVFAEDDRVFYQALLHAIEGNRKAFDAAYKSCVNEYHFDEYDFIYDDDFPEAGFAGLERSQHRLQQRRIRSLVILLSKEAVLDTQGVIAAANQAWDAQLFQESYRDIADDDNHYVCQLTDNAWILYLDGYRLFVRSQAGPFLGDAKVLAEEYPDDSKDKVLAHRGWLQVDVDVWPGTESDEDDETPQIPPHAQRLLGSLAMQLAGPQATIIIDRDRNESRELSPEVRQRLASDKPAVVFAD